MASTSIDMTIFKTKLVSNTLRTVAVKLVYSPTRFVYRRLLQGVLQSSTKRLYLSHNMTKNNDARKH